MGQCSSIRLPEIAVVDCAPVALAAPISGSSAPTRHPEPTCDGRPTDWSENPASLLEKRGFVVCVDSVDALLRQLPFELDADLDHLYELPERESWPSVVGEPAGPCFPRDVGMMCEFGGAGRFNQDNFACLQVDDVANPWGLFAVADGHGPQGHLVSTLLVHELPGLLVQNPMMHCNSDKALWQTFVAAGEMVTSCQFIDASSSGATLSTALIRDGLLHVAWVGDSKVVLGRLASRQESPAAPADSAAGEPRVSLAPASAPAAGKPRGARVAAVAQPACEAVPLRALELTADHVAKAGAASSSMPWPPVTAEADGAAGGAAADDNKPPRNLMRVFGNSRLQKGSLSCAPEVRRLRLRTEDIFVILGSDGLWARLSPAEAVALVERHLHRPASEAAAALVAEARRRSVAKSCQGDLTVIVIYLRGDQFVSDPGGFGMWHSSALDCGAGMPAAVGAELIREVREQLPQCGCLPRPMFGSAKGATSCGNDPARFA